MKNHVASRLALSPCPLACGLGQEGLRTTLESVQWFADRVVESDELAEVKYSQLTEARPTLSLILKA